VDRGYIEQITAAARRIRRAWALETRLFDDAVAARPPGDERGRTAAALGRLVPSPEFELLHRHETRLPMQYHGAFHSFLPVRQACMLNEPNPISERQADPSATPLPAPRIEEEYQTIDPQARDPRSHIGRNASTRRNAGNRHADQASMAIIPLRPPHSTRRRIPRSPRSPLARGRT
jgi:hypothetical protein